MIDPSKAYIHGLVDMALTHGNYSQREADDLRSELRVLFDQGDEDAGGAQ